MTRLVQRLRRLLGIEPGEGSVVGWSAATLFLVEWASVAVSNASDTLFLKRVGVEYLPVVFLVNSLLLTGTTLAAGRFAARADPKTLLTTTFALLAAVLAALWLLVAAGLPGMATTLVLLSKQIDVIALLMFWTVIGGLLSSRQGKRLVALMTAGGTVGTALGSFASGAFGRLLGIPALLAVAALAFLAAAAAAIPLARSTPPPLYRGAARALPAPAVPPRLATLWAESSLLRLLVATSFLAGMLGPVLYYEFSCAADLATRTADGEQRLLALYGQLRGWINVGVLVVQVAGSAALFERVGVPLAAMLAPAAYLAGFAGLGVRFGLPTAMPATMGTGVLDHTVYEPAQRILAALLPQHIRSAATGFVQGPAKRAGAALGSVLILLVAGRSGDPSHLAIAALPVAALWMGLSLLLWRGYPNLLLEAASVRVRDAADDEPVAAALDASTLRTLRGHLESSDADLRAAACALFVEAPAAVAAEALTSALATVPADGREALFGALDRVLGGGAATIAMAAMPPAVASNLLAVLASRRDLAAVERARLLHLLGLAGTGDDPALRPVLDAAMADESPGVRVAAALAALRLRPGSAPASGFDAIVAAALDSGDAVSRTAAIAGLTSVLLPAGGEDEPAWRTRLALLASHVALPAPVGDAPAPACGAAGGCVEAADAMAAVAAGHAAAVAPLAPAMLALVDDPDARVRAAVLRFVGHAGLVAHAGLLAERLSSRFDVEARAARAALEALGPAAADALLHALRHGGRRAREVAPALLRELRADPAVLAAVVDREIGHGRELLMVLGALDASPVSRLVVQRLRERVDESMQSVLELLAAILGDDRIAGVGRSLGRAWNVRDRAVLLEALEALLPAAERSRLLPLLEDQSPQRLGAAAAKALGRPWPTTAQALALALASRDPLTTGLAAATVDRRLLEDAAPELDVDAARRVWTNGAETAAAAPEGRETAAGPDVSGTAPGPPARRTAAGGGGGNAMLNPVETMLHLRTLDLFEGLTTRQLSELARVVREVEVPAGQAIVREGEFDDSMYFIVSGGVRITKGGRPVAELGARDFFGEMSLFDGERRSATATATGGVRLLRLSRHDLFEVMEDQPAIGIGICQTLVRRVRGLLDERPAAPGGDD